TWTEFGGNARDLGSFREETDKTTTLQQIFEETVHTERGDGVTITKRRRQDFVGNKSSYDLILPTVQKGLVLPAQG
ncbi:hypothetical protein Tco_0398906, partial [Tanacetum coccineum]